MKIKKSFLNGAAEVESSSKKDNRGWFTRFFCEKELAPILNNQRIVQVNCSFTKKAGSIRGLHFQCSPHQEDKLVRCLNGKVFDVILDLRKGSETYGEWYSLVLDSKENNMVYIPKGFAHGFQTLASNCELLYMHTAFYTPSAEAGYHFTSPSLNIPWPLEVADISNRDRCFDFFKKLGKRRNELQTL